MNIEVGKVYKCGDKFVRIVLRHETCVYSKYIGLSCNKYGVMGTNSYIHTYYPDGEPDQGSACLRNRLEELPKRETIQVGDSKFYLDEFKAATKNLKRVEE